VTAGTPLIEIGNPEKLEIVADYLSTDAVKIREGDRVIINEWGGDTPLNGLVRLVEPFGFMKVSALGIEEQRVNVIIDFSDSPDLRSRLGHGYRVETQVVLEKAENVLLVPLTALFRRGDDWVVFVVHEGRAALRTVQLGLRNGRFAEIRSGLQEQESLVLHPSLRIRDGDRLSSRAFDK